jgi:very-short-patch-repair endonuclease
VLTAVQLQALGLSARAIRHRAAVGRLRRLGRGVYSIGHVTDESRWIAAVMGIGGTAALSHRSAAALWGLRPDPRTVVDVPVVGARTRQSRRGVEVHSGTSLIPADVTVHDGVACTTVARTLLDVAATLDRRSLERVVDRAEELRLFDLSAVADVLARNRGRRGAARLGAALAQYAGPSITRSEVEERFLLLVRNARLPHPEVNAWIPLAAGGYRPDFLWRDARLIVEVDGRTHHARRRAFEHDRLRDRRLALAGFETRRYAAREVIQTPQAVAREIAAFLAAAV